MLEIIFITIGLVFAGACMALPLGYKLGQDSIIAQDRRKINRYFEENK